jgi:L-ascorbate metabolism protein UlaG (beta-lactamase superfamily)
MSIKLTWFGHATMQLDVKGTKLLVDPFFSGNPAASTTADKVQADYILISHGHGDHVGDAVAIAKRTHAMVISNHEIVNWFAAQGVENGHGQHLGGGYQYPFGCASSPCDHGSALPDGSNGGNPLARSR